MFNQILDTLFEDKHFLVIIGYTKIGQFASSESPAPLSMCVFIYVYIYIDICALQVETLSRYAMGYLEDHPS